MKKIWLLGLTLVGLGMVVLSISRSQPTSAPSSLVLPMSASSSTVMPSLEQEVQYKSHILPQGIVHTLLIPAQSRFVVTPALSELDTLESFAQKHRAIAALNGGFFDPKNHKSTSYVVLQGKLVADPRQNERLMNNSNLAPYLDKILNRTEFRRYLCGQTVRYDIAPHQEPSPAGCRLVDALGGGPGLLPEMTLVQEGFLDVSNGKVIRDALGSSQPNARTAVGITHDGGVVWLMVAQKPEAPTTSGMSLQALADFMKTLGVEKAVNLDGGSSSSLYYKGKTFYGKVEKAGSLVKRPVKSVLLVQENLENRR